MLLDFITTFIVDNFNNKLKEMIYKNKFYVLPFDTYRNNVKINLINIYEEKNFYDSDTHQHTFLFFSYY